MRLVSKDTCFCIQQAEQTEATAVCAVAIFASAVAEEDVAVRNTCRLGLDVASLNDAVLFAMTACSRAGSL